MKKTIKQIALLTAAILMGIFACNAADGDVKVNVSGIKGAKGNIMIAVGDYEDMAGMVTAMVPVSDGSVEVTMSLKPGTTNLYVFHDENMNFNLDRTAEGNPKEGCYMGSVDITDGTDSIEAKLWYPDTTVAE